VAVRFVDVFDLPGLARRLAEERPAGLLLEIVSEFRSSAWLTSRLFSSSASKHDVPVLVDSTFTTPYLVRPLDLGAACVIHSATKYLGGHGDVTGGVVACGSLEQAAALRGWRKVNRGDPRVLEAYLSVRGVRTLSLRVARQCANACAIADAFVRDPRIERVYYPGLADGPDYLIASRLFPEGLFGACWRSPFATLINQPSCASSSD